MRVARLETEDDFDGWRTAVRALVNEGVAPEEVVWQVGDANSDLFAGPPTVASDAPAAFSVPRPFVDLARKVVLHRDPERFALLHRLLVRLRTQPKLMDDAADPLLGKLEGYAKAVRRDIHKMRAFVRFREVTDH